MAAIGVMSGAHSIRRQRRRRTGGGFARVCKPLAEVCCGADAAPLCCTVAAHASFSLIAYQAGILLTTRQQLQMLACISCDRAGNITQNQRHKLGSSYLLNNLLFAASQSAALTQTERWHWGTKTEAASQAGHFFVRPFLALR